MSWKIALCTLRIIFCMLRNAINLWLLGDEKILNNVYGQKNFWFSPPNSVNAFILLKKIPLTGIHHYVRISWFFVFLQCTLRNAQNEPYIQFYFSNLLEIILVLFIGVLLRGGISYMSFLSASYWLRWLQTLQMYVT